MLYQIVGVKCLDFSSEKGDKIKGIKLYCTTECEDEEVWGETVDSFFIPSLSDRYDQFAAYCTSEEKIVKIVSTYFDCEFNRKGKVVSLSWLGVDDRTDVEASASASELDKSDKSDKKSAHLFKTSKSSTEIISDTAETKNV